MKKDNNIIGDIESVSIELPMPAASDRRRVIQQMKFTNLFGPIKRTM